MAHADVKQIRQVAALLAGVDLPLVPFTRALTLARRMLGTASPGKTWSTDVLARAAVQEYLLQRGDSAPASTAGTAPILELFPDACPLHVHTLLMAHTGDAAQVIFRLSAGTYPLASPRVHAHVLLPCPARAAWNLTWLLNHFRRVPVASARAALRSVHGDLELAYEVLVAQGPAKQTLARPRPPLAVASDPAHAHWAVYVQQCRLLEEEAVYRDGGPAQPGALDCCVCMDAVPHEQALACSTGAHPVCRPCLRQYLHTALYTHHKATQACVDTDCVGTYADADLRSVLRHHYQTHCQLQNREFMHAMAAGDCTVFTCACGNGAVVDDVSITTQFHCTACFRHTCMLCNCRSHVPYACGDSRAHAVEEALTAVLVRVCACGNRFLKDEGCNKMTCPCGRKMCYICKQPVTGYDHFCACPHKDTCANCHLYTDADKVDAQRLAAVTAA